MAQTLYERKAITYPRSSSRYLSEDMEAGLAKVLRALRFPGREAVVAEAQRRADAIAKGKGKKLGKRFVDGSKLSDHHAIIPTAKGGGGLSGDEARVYGIVAERFCTMFLPDRETEETRIDLLLAGHKFRAKGSVPVAAGWSALAGGGDFLPRAPDADADANDAQALPAVTKGEALRVLDAEVVTKERKPPAKYTDATLLAAMETAGKEIDDEALREAMRGRGLGTEATRASMIQQLIERDYVVRAGKTFEATGKGIALIAQVLPTLPNLASAELTGDMEAKLGLVEAGKLEAHALLNEVAEGLRKDIPKVFRGAAMAAPKLAPVQAAAGEMGCPKCKAGVLTKKPGAAFWGCSRFRDGCAFTLPGVVAGKAVTEAQAKQLISGKRRTAVVKGFTSKAGKSFDAMLVLGADWKVGFEFAR